MTPSEIPQQPGSAEAEGRGLGAEGSRAEGVGQVCCLARKPVSAPGSEYKLFLWKTNDSETVSPSPETVSDATGAGAG